MVKRNNIIKIIKKIWNGEIDKKDRQHFINLIITFEFNFNDILPTIMKILINQIKHHINIMDLHFKYSLNGKGFDDTKNEFLSLIVDKSQTILLLMLIV